jgi:hypothetical protein
MLDARHSRRDVLKTGGAVVVVFALEPLAAQGEKISWPTRTVAPDEVESYIVIDANGMVVSPQKAAAVAAAMAPPRAADGAGNESASEQALADGRRALGPGQPSRGLLFRSRR